MILSFSNLNKDKGRNNNKEKDKSRKIEEGMRKDEKMMIEEEN
jgi:hypothetical protein